LVEQQTHSLLQYPCAIIIKGEVMRRILFIAASIIVSIVVLVLAVRDVPLDGVREQLGNLDLFWLVMCGLMIIGGLWARGVRWQALLGWKITFPQAFHSSNIMFMLNFLPFRLGEVARAILASRYGVPFVSAATGVLVERLIDTVLVIIVLSFALAQIPDAPPLATQTATLFGIGAVLGFATLLLLARFPQAAERLLDLIERILPFFKRLPLRRLLHDILVGLEPLTHLRGATQILGWTLIAWTFSFSGYYSVQRALNIADINLVLNSFLSVALIAFSIAIPITVASIGPFQAAARVGGEALGLAGGIAVSIGILYHVLTFVLYSAMGIIGFIALGVSLGDVTRQAEKKPADAVVDSIS
jgi:uncharacterized protein (TIRG00374 family)